MTNVDLARWQCGTPRSSSWMSPWRTSRLDTKRGAGRSLSITDGWSPRPPTGPGGVNRARQAGRTLATGRAG
jgi:hypothetical protein